MLERRRERVSKLLDRTKSTLPRISLPVWKSAVQENLTSPAPLTGTVDQPLHILPFPASNAIPFSVSTPPPDYIEDSFKAVLTQEAAQEAAQEVTPILPWLYRACGRIGEFFHNYETIIYIKTHACMYIYDIFLFIVASIGVDAAEYLAAQLCINTLHVVDYSKIAQHRQQSELGPPWLVFDDVAWVGPTSVPSPIATTAALLHRLAHRANQHECGTLVVSLSYQPQHADEVCKALALYLHLYCGFSPRSAALSAGEAFDLDPPLQSALDAGIEEMAALGLGWLQRVILEWKYSGGCVEAAGDAVGGWDRVVPLSFNIRRRKWRVQLWGLPPGVYSYKFIVDGRWCIDVAAPSQTDVWGNANNVCAAVGCAGEDEVNQIVAASDGMAALSAFVSFNQEGPSMSRGLNVPSQAERLRLARFGASILAYYTKSTSLSRRPLPSSVRR